MVLPLSSYGKSLVARDLFGVWVSDDKSVTINIFEPRGAAEQINAGELWEISLSISGEEIKRMARFSVHLGYVCINYLDNQFISQSWCTFDGILLQSDLYIDGVYKQEDL